MRRLHQKKMWRRIVEYTVFTPQQESDDESIAPHQVGSEPHPIPSEELCSGLGNPGREGMERLR